VTRLRPETTYLVYASGEGFSHHLVSVLFSVFLIVELDLVALQLLLMGVGTLGAGEIDDEILLEEVAPRAPSEADDVGPVVRGADSEP
jgi:hypothetical protein